MWDDVVPNQQNPKVKLLLDCTTKCRVGEAYSTCLSAFSMSKNPLTHSQPVIVLDVQTFFTMGESFKPVCLEVRTKLCFVVLLMV